MDQLGAVVDRDDPHPGRQAGGYTVQLALDAINDLVDVPALAHDDDSGDGFATAVQVGGSAARGWPYSHFADVLHANDIRTCAARHPCLPELGGIIQIAAAADHV